MSKGVPGWPYTVGGRNMIAFIRQQPDVVENIMRIAALFQFPNQYVEGRHGKTELQVSTGSQQDPVTAEGGYWTSIGMTIPSYRDVISVGGIMGAPVGYRLQNVIEVPELVAEFLISRGWKWYREVPAVRGALVHPPDVEPVNNSRARTLYTIQKYVNGFKEPEYLDAIATAVAERKLMLALEHGVA